MVKSGWVGWVLGIALSWAAGGAMATPIKVPDIPTFGAVVAAPDGIAYAYHPVYVAPDGTLITNSSVGMIRSENNGEHWQKLEVEPGGILSQNDRVLLVNRKTNVFSSRDGGLSWNVEGVRQDVPWSDARWQVDERGWLYLCHENVLRISPDAGISWRELHPPKGCRLARVSEKNIHVLAAGGVQSSNDGGATWRVIDAADEAARQAIDGATKLYLMSGRSARLLVYSHADGAIHLSENGGRNWRRQGVGFPPEEAVFIVGVTPGKFDVVFFCLRRDIRPGRTLTVYRTADGISNAPIGLPYSSSRWNLSRGMNNALYVLGHFYIYMSTDEGKTWKRLGRGGITPPGYEKLPSLLLPD